VAKYVGASRAGSQAIYSAARRRRVAARQLLDTRFSDLGPTVRERIPARGIGEPARRVELPLAPGRGMRASATALHTAGLRA
jgi:hypothetical protein